MEKSGRDTACGSKTVIRL